MPSAPRKEGDQRTQDAAEDGLCAAPRGLSLAPTANPPSEQLTSSPKPRRRPPPPRSHRSPGKSCVPGTVLPSNRPMLKKYLGQTVVSCEVVGEQKTVAGLYVRKMFIGHTTKSDLRIT